jgi:hypothetical protein
MYFRTVSLKALGLGRTDNLPVGMKRGKSVTMNIVCLGDKAVITSFFIRIAFQYFG